MLSYIENGSQANNDAIDERTLSSNITSVNKMYPTNPIQHN